MVPLGQLEAFGKADTHSSVEINNSCNNCCCWPRRIKKQTHHHKPPIHEQPEHLPQAITTTHTVSMPVLKETGEWEVEIDGIKHSLSANAVGQSIIKEHSK